MRHWGPGLLENDAGEALRGEWQALSPRPGGHPLQPYIDAIYRWTRAWRESSDGGGPDAWIALAVLQASAEFLDEDVTLEALAAVDRGAVFDGADLSAEDQESRHSALRELRELLARTIGDEGTEDDLHRIAALGSRRTLGPT